jgi:hypothetical protein
MDLDHSILSYSEGATIEDVWKERIAKYVTWFVDQWFLVLLFISASHLKIRAESKAFEMLSNDVAFVYWSTAQKFSYRSWLINIFFYAQI